jgi:hypothetical protein
MKTFKEYLAESKKVYPFKIKVAGELPEGFEGKLKSQLASCGVTTFENQGTTPIQKLPLDFPEMTNTEVTTFEVVCEYPITAPEIVNHVKSLGMTEACFRVRNSGEAIEIEQAVANMEPSGEALLNDSQYKETTNAKHKEYFGNDFNNSFLKDLAKAAKERKKSGANSEYKLPKAKTDKSGTSSAVGSK